MINKARLCLSCNKNTIYFDGICFECRARKKREIFLNLTPKQIEAKVQNILAHIENGGKFDDVRDDFWGLFCIRGINDERIARAAIRHDIYWPHEIYYRAPDDVRDELLKRLDSTNDLREANRLLCVLAMQAGGAKGDARVLSAFCDLELNPKEWRKNLNVDPCFYAQIGGWTFDKNGVRKSLVFDKCVALKSCEGEKFDMKFSLTGQKCPSCDCEIVELLNLKANEPRLSFLNLKNDLKFHACANCIGINEGGFCKTDESGQTILFGGARDRRENYFGEADFLNELKFEFVPQEVPPFYGAFSELDITIGGEASWVQDAEFLKCPQCGETMKFIAQIPFGTLTDGEGVIFIQICKECEITGGNFQCT